MRIAQACNHANLSERAIRLYIKEGLLSPSQRNGILDFSQDDIDTLRLIARLRKGDFSIPQIHALLHSPERTGDVIGERIARLQADAERSNDLMAALKGLQSQKSGDAREIAKRLESVHGYNTPPDFSRFDPLSQDARQAAQADARAAIDALENKRTAQKRRVPLCIAIALLFAALVFALHLSKPPSELPPSPQQLRIMQNVLRRQMDTWHNEQPDREEALPAMEGDR